MRRPIRIMSLRGKKNPRVIVMCSSTTGVGHQASAENEGGAIELWVVVSN